MPVNPIVVDAHSHVFNAEDLPIDGFVKELAPIPKFMTHLLSGPLDKVAAWLAPGESKEIDAIKNIVNPPDTGFVSPEPSRWERGIDFDEPAADAGFVVGSDTAVQVPTLPTEAEFKAAIEQASQEELSDLDAWLEESTNDEDAFFAESGFTFGDLRPDRLAKAVGRYAKVLRLITRFRYLVVADLATTYPQVELFVPALVDFTAATSDSPSTSVRDQVKIHSFVSKLSVLGKIPGAPQARVHPFVGYDPLRELRNSLLEDWDPNVDELPRYVPFGELVNPDEQDRYTPGMVYDPARARALEPLDGEWFERSPKIDGAARSLDIVRYAIEQGGFAGVKIYPPTGFLPLGNHTKFPEGHGHRLDVAMRAFFAYCEAEHVPILTHAAHSNGFRKGFDLLAGPDGWRLVLNEFPTLRVSFGHFGHMHDIGDDHDNPDEFSWPSQFAALIDEFPNVYGDVGNSKLPVSKDYRRDFTRVLSNVLGGDSPTSEQQKRRKRLLYGSDYWMNRMAPAHPEFLTTFDSVITDTFDPDTRNAFMGMNALRWLGCIDDDDEIVADNKNRLRLVEFYGDNPRPEWLG